MISDDQVDYVINEIDKSGITDLQLKDNLIDHFCCLIEIELDKGEAFLSAYEKAYKSTTPNGIDEIQEETLFLLNYKKIKLLKISLHLNGFIFSMILSTGCLFIILKLPYAAILVISGLCGLVFIFFPLLLINHFKHEVSAVLSQKLKIIIGGLSLIMITLGTCLKLMHLKGAALILVVGFVVLGLGFFPYLFFSKTYSRNSP